MCLSCGCCNKLPHGQWLKTTPFYYITILEVRHGNSSATLTLPCCATPIHRFWGSGRGHLWKPVLGLLQLVISPLGLRGWQTCSHLAHVLMSHPRQPLGINHSEGPRIPERSHRAQGSVCSSSSSLCWKCPLSCTDSAPMRGLQGQISA